MKKLITLMAVATLLIFSLSSCKKTDEIQTPKTVIQKKQANWQLSNYYGNDHFGGADHITNITGTAGDYIEFRTDGKVYYSIQGNKDTTTYSLLTDIQFLIGGSMKYDIKTLTDNGFIFYGKDVSGADFLEETFTMKK